MKIITTTAPRAGACMKHVQTEPAAFQPVLRRDLLRALRKCRARLALSTGDILVLDTLLSFLPCRDRVTRTETPIKAGLLLVVYASNRSICERANGMDERVLRRHIARLVNAGLLARQDSATGKRFPIKSNGRVTTAYGLDLTPLLFAAAKIIRTAREIEQDEEQVRNLRTRALALRADLLRHAEALGEDALAFVEGAKTMLRRTTLGLKGVSAILDRLLALTRQAPCPTENPHPAAETTPLPHAQAALKSSTDPAKESGVNGRNVRQVETCKKETYTTPSISTQSLPELWQECREVRTLFPKVPSSVVALREVVYLMGSFVGISERRLADGISSLSWDGVLRALDQMAERSGEIEKPDAYFGKICKSHHSTFAQAFSA